MDGKRACYKFSHRRGHMRRRRYLWQSSLFTGGDESLLLVSRSNGQNGGELRQSVEKVAKRYELRAARSSRCEESLRW
jgi:hypothetical protein